MEAAVGVGRGGSGKVSFFLVGGRSLARSAVSGGKRSGWAALDTEDTGDPCGNGDAVEDGDGVDAPDAGGAGRLAQWLRSAGETATMGGNSGGSAG